MKEYTIEEAGDQYEFRSYRENKQEYRSGFEELDKYVRPLRGDVVMITARPGMGSTAFLLNSFLNCVQKDRHSAMLFLPEKAKEAYEERLFACNGAPLNERNYYSKFKNGSEVLDRFMREELYKTDFNIIDGTITEGEMLNKLELIHPGEVDAVFIDDIDDILPGEIYDKRTCMYEMIENEWEVFEDDPMDDIKDMHFGDEMDSRTTFSDLDRVSEKLDQRAYPESPNKEADQRAGNDRAYLEDAEKWYDAASREQKAEIDTVFFYNMLHENIDVVADPENNYLTILLEKIKRIAAYKGFLVAVSLHAGIMADYRQSHRPMLHDLRKFGEIEEQIDFVLSPFRKSLYETDTTHDDPRAEIIILKSPTLHPASVDVSWDSDCACFRG